MAKFDVHVDRSYTERDCPPCPAPVHSCGCNDEPGPVAAFFGCLLMIFGVIGLIAVLAVIVGSFA